MRGKGIFPIEKFKDVRTPFYFYDLKLLRKTLETISEEAKKYNFKVHYAMKANANAKLISIIRDYGLGADCVSGGEIQAAIDAGFPASKIVYAGVGKDDWEINLALDNDIFSFNCESIPEIEVINELAGKKGKVARIALRINPNVKADTHSYITTGTNENKFGIPMIQMDEVVSKVKICKNIKLVGIHFHIGSQILVMDNFAGLCVRINELQSYFEEKGVKIENINVGGGLGIDYENPTENPIPSFGKYFETFKSMLDLREGQTLHFEPGRSVVGQCGSLVTKVLYVKPGVNKQFAIVDAGMTDLIRPALYQAYHKIENISSESETEKYDVVGPICESSDCFGKEVELNGTKRGDYIVLRSAGAYGEIMASQYNLRKLPGAFYYE